MIKFGPSGNSTSFYSDGNKYSEQAFSWLYGKGLTAYEYSFGRGVRISPEKVFKMREESAKYGVEISVHAPYYVNFANPSNEMIEKSISYIVESAKKLIDFGGKRLVFHPASVGKMQRQTALDLCYKNFEKLLDAIYKNNIQDLYFCPETMGKINQIGDEIEIARLCAMDKCLIPAVDFGHLNARTFGGIKDEDDYLRIIDNVSSIVGGEKTKIMHVHFSQIEYSKGGEVRHLTFDDNFFGPSYQKFLNVVAKCGLSPVVICESDGTQAEDAQKMKNYYENIII